MGSRRARPPSRRAGRRLPPAPPSASGAGVARVVEVTAHRDAEDRAAVDEVRPAAASRRRSCPRARPRRRRPRPAASAISVTTSGSTAPSNRQPNATLIVAVVGRSAPARIRSTRSVASASVALPLRRLNSSVAASVTLTGASAWRRAAPSRARSGRARRARRRDHPPRRRPPPRPPSAAPVPG